MNHFDGSTARQLELIDDSAEFAAAAAPSRERARPTMRLLRQDIYAELNRRRRRAQIAARHVIESE